MGVFRLMQNTLDKVGERLWDTHTQRDVQFAASESIISFSMSSELEFHRSHAAPPETCWLMCVSVFGCGQWELGRLQRKLLSAVTVLHAHTHTHKVPEAEMVSALLAFISFHSPIFPSITSLTDLSSAENGSLLRLQTRSDVVSGFCSNIDTAVGEIKPSKCHFVCNYADLINIKLLQAHCSVHSSPKILLIKVTAYFLNLVVMQHRLMSVCHWELLYT